MHDADAGEWRAFEELAPLEGADRLSEWTSADAEPVGQGLLRKLLPLRQLTGEDRLFKAGDNLVDESAAGWL
ncbi:hypothetical protein AOQ71_16415 [Bradyrhizobium manausense]|uniref:Uncharacterized protein n=1 Tax=Bradyrhizobium manausense TaxID=989370 RepID=A0A0R3DX68_9BRAD|nr:hypothetical protein AOQ71_16415 [Bradyrhizobium manausense]